LRKGASSCFALFRRGQILEGAERSRSRACKPLNHSGYVASHCKRHIRFIFLNVSCKHHPPAIRKKLHSARPSAQGMPNNATYSTYSITFIFACLPCPPSPAKKYAKQAHSSSTSLCFTLMRRSDSYAKLPKRAIACTRLPRPTQGTPRPETLAAPVKRSCGSPVWTKSLGRQGVEQQGLSFKIFRFGAKQVLARSTQSTSRAETWHRLLTKILTVPEAAQDSSARPPDQLLLVQFPTASTLSWLHLPRQGHLVVFWLQSSQLTMQAWVSELGFNQYYSPPPPPG